MKYLRALLLSMTTLASIAASAGGWSGSGGFQTNDHDNIWFLGKDTVPYCVVSNESSMLEGALKIMVQNDLDKWSAFFQRYGISSANLGEGSMHFQDSVPRSIATNFSPSNQCDDVRKACVENGGDENRCREILQDKVLFLFGKPNDVVQKYLTVSGEAQGIALRTDYNNQTFRAGGIIWINEMSGGWSARSHILLHEMGHMFGMKHDSCWVMSSKVSNFIANWTGLGKLETIEAPNWPYSYHQGDTLIFTDADLATGGTVLNPGFYPMSTLNPYLRNKFGFLIGGYYQVRADILSTDSYSTGFKLHFIEQASLKDIQLVGVLINVPAVLAPTAPGVYTSWYDEYGNKSLVTQYITTGWVSDNMVGNLNYAGENVAIVLQRKNGLQLGLKFSDSTDWTWITTVQFPQNRRRLR